MCCSSFDFRTPTSFLSLAMTRQTTFFQVSNLSSPFQLPTSNSSNGPSASQKPWQNVSFQMQRGDVILVQGPSGSGKTTLLKSLADLVPLDQEDEQGSSQVSLLGLSSTSSEISPSIFRSRVSYIPQRPSLYPGSPLDFLTLVNGFNSNRKDVSLPIPSSSKTVISDEEAEVANGEEILKGKGWRLVDAKKVFNIDSTSNSSEATDLSTSASSTPLFKSANHRDQHNDFTIQSLGYPIPSDPNLPSPNLGPDPIFFSSAYWNLPTRVWRSDWSQISGGEAQRVGLAIGLGMKVRQKGEGVLLLDEPTSALDLQTTQAIERTLLLNPTVLTIVWITHSDDQSKRVTELVEVDNKRRKEAGDSAAIGERKVRILYLGEDL